MNKGIDMEDLFSVVARNDEVELHRALESGRDPNLRDADQRTPLTYAALGGNDQLVQILIASKANIDAQDKMATRPYTLRHRIIFPQ